MLAAVVIAMTMFVGQAAVLPDTPQGKAVEAWVAAFNSGDEKVFEKAQQDLMVPGVLGKRTPEERAKMFQRLKGDFGTMTVEKVTRNTAQQVAIQVPTRDGATGTLTFDFDDTFKIVGLGVEVEGGGGA